MITTHPGVASLQPLIVWAKCPTFHTTKHKPEGSALSLFMLWIFADDHDAAFSADDFAFIADRFYGRFHFHVLYLLSGRQTAAYARLFGSPCDPAT